MDFETLNRICSNSFLPRKSLSELQKDVAYIVTQIKRVNTRFGAKVVVVLNEEFQVFLPDRASRALDKNENLYDEMAAKANKYDLSLIYLGDNKFKFK